MKSTSAPFWLLFLLASVAVASPRPAKDPARGVAELAAAMDQSLRIDALRNGELGVTTFVDLNDLEQAAPIGRYLQERLINELFRRNYRVIEIRLGKEIAFAPPVGEMSLTRVADRLKAECRTGLKGAVVGTYIRTSAGLQVGVRLVELESCQVRASGETLIANGRMLQSLFPRPAAKAEPPGRGTEVYERLPVPPAPAAEN